MYDRFLNDIFTQSFCGNKKLDYKFIDNENYIILDLKCPGLTKQDFEIKVEGNILKIKTIIDKISLNVSDISVESIIDKIDHEFKLPETIDKNQIKAKVENGILVIVFPKKDKDLITIDIK